ncbi:MAG: bifunctional demethylmenaquinone methyltransferase/2-methoxy-6-polyprenyl-1,4-benzoquinol methylase UbiE [Bacteroidetes bacterium]|nr:bifunctional demethylmenaquinone methyltransferase/2-methoxy-6-polyprenyl-1,4-benzoquinol methylase UbiE [Bacteroidota bacterium]MDA0874185.1 bifunctional demethylmenaquinone methyltransferase/2-methoxy-6-polyprenyl-1,4-benzoquinol methylase UbiE [Bacteroidota bacterium]
MPDRSVPPIGIVEGKKPHIERMFDSIAPRYDLLNRVLSGGIDQRWRRRVIGEVLEHDPERVLDIATGTADLAIQAARQGVDRVVGVDISEEMLEVGRGKVRRGLLESKVTLQRGDAEKLPFSDKQFHAAMVAFGVRNFEDLGAGLAEIHRILKPGGKFVVLEFSRPAAFPIKQLYAFYSRFILPLIGRLVSGDSGAYTYLPESISVFPEGEDFLEWMRKAGFQDLRAHRLTFGIASMYVGYRRR